MPAFFVPAAVLVAILLFFVVDGCLKKDRAWVVPLLGGGFFGLLWAIVLGYSLHHVPGNWLGLMDGYLYEMAIKHFMHSFWLTDWAGGGIATYPPYFFYIVGKVAALLGMQDAGHVYALSFVVTYLLTPSLSYFFLREVMRKEAAALAALLLPLVFVTGDYANFVQKPHEIMAASLLLPAFLVFLSPTFTQLSRAKRMLTGAALALATGMYTPFAIGLGLAVVALLAFDAARMLGVKTTPPPTDLPAPPLFRHILDWPFLVSAGLVLAPWLFTYLYGVVTHGQGPHVPYYTTGDLNLWLFDFSRNGCFYYLAFAAVLYGLLGKPRDTHVARIAVGYFAVLLVMLLSVLRALLGQYQTSAMLSVVLLVLLGLYVLTLLADKASSPVLLQLLKTGLFILLIICPYSFYNNIANSPLMGISRNISKGRDDNQELQAAVQAIDASAAVKDDSVYLGNGEFQFANFYTRKKEIFPRLYYNHTYVSSYEPRLAYMQLLREAVDKQSYPLFRASLATMRVDLLLLRLEDDKQHYRLFMNVNHPNKIVKDTNQEDFVFMLPKAWIDALSADPLNTVLYQNDFSVVLLLHKTTS